MLATADELWSTFKTQSTSVTEQQKWHTNILTESLLGWVFARRSLVLAESRSNLIDSRVFFSFWKPRNNQHNSDSSSSPRDDSCLWQITKPLRSVPQHNWHYFHAACFLILTKEFQSRKYKFQHSINKVKDNNVGFTVKSKTQATLHFYPYWSIAQPQTAVYC